MDVIFTILNYSKSDIGARPWERIAGEDPSDSGV